mmetsp:Transcript_123969/g.396311  ORF Transcript_123969/g.396311 Transcript_123969/m.396311 type:complete len:383 (+) Transcript_123969:126-1274(+)
MPMICRVGQRRPHVTCVYTHILVRTHCVSQSLHIGDANRRPGSHSWRSVQVGQVGRVHRLVQPVSCLRTARDDRCLHRSVSLHGLDKTKGLLTLLLCLLDEPSDGLLRVDRLDVRGRLEHRRGRILELPIDLGALVPIGGGRIPIGLAILLAVPVLALRPPAACAVLTPLVPENALTVEAILKADATSRGARRGRGLLVLEQGVEVAHQCILEGVLLLRNLSCAVAQSFESLLELEVAEVLLVVQIPGEVDQIVGLFVFEVLLLLLSQSPERLHHFFLPRFLLRLHVWLCIRPAGLVPLRHHHPHTLAVLVGCDSHALLPPLFGGIVLVHLVAFALHLLLELPQPPHVLPQRRARPPFLEAPVGAFGALGGLAGRQAQLLAL